MNKALIIIKSTGIGDLQILLSNIHQISKEIDKPVTVLAQKNTRAEAIFKHDPFVNEVMNLDKGNYVTVPFGTSKITGIVWNNFEKTEKKFQIDRKSTRLNSSHW